MSLSFLTKSDSTKYHLIAILTVGVWGTTFSSTKILIENGLSPQDIFFPPLPDCLPRHLADFTRAILAYRWKDELLFLGSRTDRGFAVFP